MPEKKSIDSLKKDIVDKVLELIDCAKTLKRTDFFEITLKIVNGELLANIKFSDKGKVSKFE